MTTGSLAKATEIAAQQAEAAERARRGERIEKLTQVALGALAELSSLLPDCERPVSLLGTEAWCVELRAVPNPPRQCDACVASLRLMESDVSLRAAVALLWVRS